MEKLSGNSVEACVQSLVCTGGCTGLHHPAQMHCEGWFRTPLHWYQYSTAQELHNLAAKAMSCAVWPQVFEQGLLHLLCHPEIPPGHETETTGLRQQHPLVNVPSGKTAPPWGL